MTEFLAMGGDGAYVWSAYGITLAVLVLNVWSANRLRKANLERARRFAVPERPARQATVRQLQ
jgi:heme exporter protein D